MGYGAAGVRDVIENGRQDDYTLLNIKFIRKMRKLQILFAKVVIMIHLNILLLFLAFYAFSPKKGEKPIFNQKWVDFKLLMTSCLISIATECGQTLPK